MFFEQRNSRKPNLIDRHGGRVPGTAGHHGQVLRPSRRVNPPNWRRPSKSTTDRDMPGDALPKTKTGQALALADKLDTLVGIFAIEQRPTGTKDPFGLRRAALGVLRIILEGGLNL